VSLSLSPRARRELNDEAVGDNPLQKDEEEEIAGSKATRSNGSTSGARIYEHAGAESRGCKGQALPTLDG
jgi:hypothetical protein